ncbi:MAG: extracellular solute-binding protein [Lachnospiraceae bacterium]|nr:extracellular solute-binding protein [Lachnospiraceae bacterium]
MIRRLLALLICVVMVLSLTACTNNISSNKNNGGASNGSGSSGTGNNNQNINDTNSQPGQGKIKLTMWCIATESDSNRRSYENAIEDMRTRYPDIEFEWEAIENEAYKTKIRSAVAANELPDIFFTWSGAFLGGFVEADKVYCLDDVLVKYENELPESMLGNTTYNGKHYGIPTTMNIVGLFANMELLSSVGYDDIPGTFDEFIVCCDKLIAEGIIPFGCAGSETWCVTEYLESVLEKSIGVDAMNDIFLGKASWDNEEVAKAVDTFQSMIKNGYFDPEGEVLSNDEIQDNFMAGKYAFYMNGTWNCADFASDPEFFPKVKVAEFPVINPQAAKLGQMIGGPADTLAVAAVSPNAAKAAEYAAELGKLICHYGYLDGCGLPAWTPYGDTSSINTLTQTVAEICADADAYVLFGDIAMNSEDKDQYLDYVAKVYTCEINGTDFVKGMKEAIQ